MRRAVLQRVGTFNVKHMVCAVIALGLLAGCAAPNAYRPMSEGQSYGYREEQISGNRYRVTFKGNSATKTETVKDFALLRAAEITLEKGYRFFNVVDRTLETEGGTRPLSHLPTAHPPHLARDCGLLGCRTSLAPLAHRHLDPAPLPPAPRVTSSLEILLLNENTANSQTTYNAGDTAKTLRARLIEP